MGADDDATCCRANGCPAPGCPIAAKRWRWTSTWRAKSGSRPTSSTFRVRHPAPADGPAIAGFVGGWLKDEALRSFAPEVGALATRLGVPPPPVKISCARTEWGSCTRAGVVRLNRRLVHLPPPLARYVVAHEVAHLAEMNHSPRFWARVETLYPGHAAARRALDDWTAVLEA
ncbi:MAG: DUF45 domain-containing protein [Betaproteobacteria bacterium]|nr:DUF45 domain-containing protein [Betaproteobacteria bacterium]